MVMIEFLNSKRMTIVIIGLIFFCLVVVIVEEFVTNSQVPAVYVSPPAFAQDKQISSSQSKHTSNQEKQVPDHIIKPNIANKETGQLASQGDNSTQILPEAHYNHKKCFLKENYFVVKPCALCAVYEQGPLNKLNNDHHKFDICKQTGYKEIVYCSKSGHAERICEPNLRHFFLTLFSFTFFGTLCALGTSIYQRQLRRKYLTTRFRKEKDSDIKYTSIGMSDIN